MPNCVLANVATSWRVLSHLHRSLSQRSIISSSIFERIPREELITKFQSRLKDRPFLPGASEGGFPEFLSGPRDSFPLAVQVLNSKQSFLRELTTKCMEYMEQNIFHSPAILFRGLPAKTAEDFTTIAQAIKGQTLTHQGGLGNRSRVDEKTGTYTASDHPKPFTIELHNELSFNDIFPSKVFFLCLREPSDGCSGETPLAKNSELISKLDPDVLRKFEEKNIKYTRYLPLQSPGDQFSWMTWQETFATDDKKVVEKRAREQGYNIKWDDNGDLHMWQNRSAFIRHPDTGEKIWFNQVHLHSPSYHKAHPKFVGTELPNDKFPAHSYYGDGSQIEPEVLQHIRATSWACAVGFQWRTGDLLVMNNLAVQHGRIGYTGDRKILAYLTA